jgi:hypothetical protein
MSLFVHLESDAEHYDEPDSNVMSKRVSPLKGRGVATAVSRA